MGAMHHWGESQFGYYLADDAYVLRRHAQMLADAGVDFIVFDVTNQATYKSYYMALLKVFAEIRAAGGRTPQVAFLTPFWDPPRVVAQLYADLYQPGLYSDLWFRWEGKPLILADPALIGRKEGTDAHDGPAQLTPGHTLGQSFTVTNSFESVAAQCPTYATTDSGVTLALHRDGPQGEQLATADVQPPHRQCLGHAAARARRSAPGTYYLELSNPRGTPGWWSHSAKVWPGGQAFADGVATNGSRNFRIGTLNDETPAHARVLYLSQSAARLLPGPDRPGHVELAGGVPAARVPQFQRREGADVGGRRAKRRGRPARLAQRSQRPRPQLARRRQ